MVYRVVNNKIENAEGIIIEHLGIVYDIQAGGCLKHGDLSKGFLEDYHKTVIEEFSKAGLQDVAESIVLLKLDNYKDLTLEEICTLSNYIIEVSAIPGILENYLKLSTQELKDKLKELKELGF